MCKIHLKKLDCVSLNHVKFPKIWVNFGKVFLVKCIIIKTFRGSRTWCTLRSVSYGSVLSHRFGPRKAACASTFQGSPSSLCLSSPQISLLLLVLPRNKETTFIKVTPQNTYLSSKAGVSTWKAQSHQNTLVLVHKERSGRHGLDEDYTTYTEARRFEYAEKMEIGLLTICSVIFHQISHSRLRSGLNFA